MLRHRVNADRIQHRKISPDFSYENDLNGVAGIDWWHLQELKNLIAHAKNDALALGRELILDPGFDDAARWTLNGLGTSWSIAAGVAHCTSADAFASMSTVDTETKIYAGRSYVVEFTISNAATFARLDFYATNGGGINELISQASYANDSYSIPFTPPATMSPSPGTNFYILARSAGSAFDIDNVSLKQTGILGYEQYPGADVITNGDFGTGDLTNWTTTGATSTFEVVGGRAHVVGNDAFVSLRQDIASGISVGDRDQIKFKLEVVSGNAIVEFSNGGVEKYYSVSFGTGIHSLTVISDTITDIGAMLIQFYTTDNAEYYVDDVSIRPANPMHGDNTACAVGQLADGNLGYRYVWDGSISVLDNTSAEANGKLNPTDKFHVLLWMQKTTWDATERDILSYTVDANNWIRIVDTTTPGTISWQFRAGGITEEVTLATGSPTTDVLVGLSLSGGVMKAWYGTGQTGSDQAVAGTFEGNFETMLIGARTTVPTFVHLGGGGHVGTANRELSPTEWSDIEAGGNV